MFWSDYVAIFLLGLSGTGHCVGMCGGFAVAASAGAQRVGGAESGGRDRSWAGAVVRRQLSYQFGKASAYVAIGLVLLLGVGWVDARWPLLRFQDRLSVATGMLMIVLGAMYAAEWRLPAGVARWWQGSGACAAVAGVWTSPSVWRSVLIGWVNGFLPCGLSWAALLSLANRESVVGVVAGSYVFGLGTLPGLLAVGLLGQRLGVVPRHRLVRVGGVALVIFGVLTVVRGLPMVNHWVHAHLLPGGAEWCEKNPLP